MLKAIIIGHLGKDAEVKDVNGKKVINFSVAHTEKYKDSQGAEQSKTTWVECAKWGETTAIAPYLKKGTQVYVEGTPEIRTWEKDGKTNANFACRVGMVQLLSGGEKVAAAPAPTAATPIADSNTAADDLPF